MRCCIYPHSPYFRIRPSPLFLVNVEALVRVGEGLGGADVAKWKRLRSPLPMWVTGICPRAMSRNRSAQEIRPRFEQVMDS